MRFRDPFEPGDVLSLNPSWPLINGLIFACTNNDGASGLVTPVGSSRDLTTQKPVSAGLIHTSATPWGRGRNRTDASSPLKWSAEEKHLFTTGDFTIAFYGWLRGSGSVLNILSNEAGSNQWRLLQDCDAAIAYSSTNLTFWTYDGATTVVAGGVGSIVDAPAWYIARRIGTSLTIYRNGVLLNSATGTARNVTGSTVSSTKPINMGWGAGNSTGLHGPALVWRRGLSMPEIQQLVSGNVFDFVAKQPARFFVAQTTTSSASMSTTAADSTVTASASVSPVATASITTADSTVTASASTSAVVSGALTTADSAVSASAHVSPVATASITTDADTFSGSASSGSSVASMSITTEDAFASALASVSPVSMMAVYTDDAVVSGSAQGQVSGVYPDPATVLAGVAYGPSGSDYTGTLAYASAVDIGTEILLRLQATVIPVNLTQVRGQTIGGSGTANDPWGP